MKRLFSNFLCFAIALLFLCSCAGCEAEQQSSSSLLFEQPDAQNSSSSGVQAPAQQEKGDHFPSNGDNTEAETTLSVVTGTEAFVYPSRKGGEPLASFPEGSLLQIQDDPDEPIWFEITLENGSTGFLYGETLFPLHEDGKPDSESLSAQRVSQKLSELEKLFPEGKYWNHMGSETEFGTQTPFSVTDTPCEHSVWGETWCNIYNGVTLDYFPEYGYLSQCMGFASFLSDQIFTSSAPLHVFYDPSLLRPGDHIRLHDYEHSMIVVEKNEEGVRVSEVNKNYEDCLISWSRVLPYWELEELIWDSTYISRYPMYPEEDGACSFWEFEELAAD